MLIGAAGSRRGVSEDQTCHLGQTLDYHSGLVKRHARKIGMLTSFANVHKTATTPTFVAKQPKQVERRPPRGARWPAAHPPISSMQRR